MSIERRVREVKPLLNVKNINSCVKLRKLLLEIISQVYTNDNSSAKVKLEISSLDHKKAPKY